MSAPQHDLLDLPRRADRRPGPRWLRRVPDDWEPAWFVHLSLSPLSPTIGAVVEGVDLREPLDASVHDELHRALLEWKVLVLHDQHLSAAQQVAVARLWGEVEQHPFISAGSLDTVQRFEKGAGALGYENEWHADNTWREQPSFGAVLRALEVPEVGGDTLFADMAVAYDNLPGALQERLDGLQAVHDWLPAFGHLMDEPTRAAWRARFPAVQHPVVRTHPETGRPTLFVNSNFTTGIVGMAPDESAALLDHLYRQADIPEYQCRVRWRPGTVVLWDNRAVQHYAASDYWPERRVMERVAIVGDRPF